MLRFCEQEYKVEVFPDSALIDGKAEVRGGESRNFGCSLEGVHVSQTVESSNIKEVSLGKKEAWNLDSTGNTSGLVETPYNYGWPWSRPRPRST